MRRSPLGPDEICGRHSRLIDRRARFSDRGPRRSRRRREQPLPHGTRTWIHLDWSDCTDHVTIAQDRTIDFSDSTGADQWEAALLQSKSAGRGVVGSTSWSRAACDQKTTFSEKSMLLGSDAELVTVPKAELVGVVLGAANTGWFSVLKHSARNCTAMRSRSR